VTTASWPRRPCSGSGCGRYCVPNSGELRLGRECGRAREYGRERAALYRRGRGAWLSVDWRGRARRRGSVRACGRVCTGASAAVKHVALCICPVPALIGSVSSRIWARSLCKICSPDCALSFLCGSQGVFMLVQRVVASPSRVYLTALSRGKSTPRSCQIVGACLQTSPGRVWGNLAPLWYLDHVVLSFGIKRTRLIFAEGLDFRILNFRFSFEVPTWVADLRILQNSFG
jgi:hypothetical protein